MKAFLRLACLAALLPLPAYASEPTNVDVYRELIRHRIADVGVDATFDYDTRGFVSSFLEDPDSPYSNLRSDPPITNELWWYDFAEGLPIDVVDKSAKALEILQWQGGFTKARIGVDLVVDDAAVKNYHGGYAAANAIKAGVDVDIFWKARDLNGSLTTVAAGHAVALQLLRDQVLSHPADTYEARGIKPGVLDRYLNQQNPELLEEGDVAYLADLLSFAISDHSFSIDRNGKKQLPAAYRVARVAAAYADARGYFNPQGYCKGNDPRPGVPTGPNASEYHAPLCFVTATDRAVQSWLRREMRQEEANVREARHWPNDAKERVQFWFNTILTLVDLAGFAEFGEASLVDELREEGAITEEDAAVAQERARQLTCRIRS